jgi:acyl-CoA reductase-like NAD-dependent aldehyde dehydrogenase
VNGDVLTAGSTHDTVDAFNNVNGKTLFATDAEVDHVIAHMHTFAPAKVDWRTEVRAIEADIFENWTSFLIGNQAMDFKKQDGVTEIEESVQANVVEARLSDQLFADEVAGTINIDRSPAFVACVSNFTNFLDLFRKVLRNVELGVPVVVLSRANTTQHMYRWFQMLDELAGKHGLDKGMITFLSADLESQQRVMASMPTGPIHFTGSRPVAEQLRKQHGPVMASTGGPNTLVSTKYTAAVQEAIRLSAMIENSGQCTALRHAVVPSVSVADMEAMFDNAPTVQTSKESLEQGAFAAVFNKNHPFHRAEGYTFHPELDAGYRVSGELPPKDIDEM